MKPEDNTCVHRGVTAPGGSLIDSATLPPSRHMRISCATLFFIGAGFLLLTVAYGAAKAYWTEIEIPYRVFETYVLVATAEIALVSLPVLCILAYLARRKRFGLRWGFWSFLGQMLWFLPALSLFTTFTMLYSPPCESCTSVRHAFAGLALLFIVALIFRPGVADLIPLYSVWVSLFLMVLGRNTWGVFSGPVPTAFTLSASLCYYGRIFDCPRMALAGVPLFAISLVDGGVTERIFPVPCLPGAVALFGLGLGTLLVYCVFRDRLGHTVALLVFLALFLGLAMIPETADSMRDRRFLLALQPRALAASVFISVLVVALSRDPFLLCAAVFGGIIYCLRTPFGLFMQFLFERPAWHLMAVSFVLLGAGVWLSLRRGNGGSNLPAQKEGSAGATGRVQS